MLNVWKESITTNLC